MIELPSDGLVQLIDLIRAIRNLRTEEGLEAGRRVVLQLRPASPAAEASLAEARREIEALARVEMILPATDAMPAHGIASTALGAGWLEISAEQAAEAAARHDARVRALTDAADRVRRLLADPAFTSRAPAAVVDRERQRLADLEDQLGQLAESG